MWHCVHAWMCGGWMGGLEGVTTQTAPTRLNNIVRHDAIAAQSWQCILLTVSAGDSLFSQSVSLWMHRLHSSRVYLSLHHWNLPAWRASSDNTATMTDPFMLNTCKGTQLQVPHRRRTILQSIILLYMFEVELSTRDYRSTSRVTRLRPG